MSELEFAVLASLAGGPKHGYGVLSDVRELSGGVVDPQVPTLYRLLDRLAAAGAVAEVGTEVVAGRFRRYYALTDEGAAQLDAAVAQRRRSTKAAQRRLKIRAGEVRPGWSPAS